MSDTVKTTTFDVSEYLQKLVKLIPSEVILLYSAALAFMPGNLTAQLVIIGVCTVLTPLYLLFAAKVKNYLQVVLSTLSFVVYSFASGGALTTAPWYQSWIPGLVLMLFTFIVPMFVKTPEVATTASKSGTKAWRQI